MKKKQTKMVPVKMWAVFGYCGLYVDTAYTRKDMIERHVSALGYDWNYHKKKGDRLIRVIVSEVPRKRRKCKP